MDSFVSKGAQIVFLTISNYVSFEAELHVDLYIECNEAIKCNESQYFNFPDHFSVYDKTMVH